MSQNARTVTPPEEAFEFDTSTYFKGVEYYWRVQERLWNIDTDPDPLKRRQYILGRPVYETFNVKTKRLSEIDILSHFEEVPKEEAEEAFDAQQSAEKQSEASASLADVERDA